MPNFFVRYKYGPNRETAGKVVFGSNGRDAARQIREQYRDVKIESIEAASDGVGKGFRRRPWER